MSFDNEKWYYMEDEKDGSTYRYVLGEKGENPLVVFGINPSTATPEKLDQTMIVVKRLVDSENNDYDGYIKELTRDKKCVDIWAAWGGNIDRRDYLIKSLVDIEKMIRPYSVRWLEKGKYKNPHHPLYLKKTLEFEEFDVEGYINKKLRR